MKLLELLKALLTRPRSGVALKEVVRLPRASARIQTLRPKRDQWGVPLATYSEDGQLAAECLNPDGTPRLELFDVIDDEVSHNVITTVGRDYLHSQGYNTSGGAANGFCYIALSNDALTETSASTTLSTEIAANGLTRAVGVYAHTTGTNTSTITKTFTCSTLAQAAQKAALFTASSSGTMNHALAFTQRTLQIGDTLAVTFTITLG